MLGHRTLSPADYWTILKRRGWIVAICLVVFPIIAGTALYFIPPRFQSQSLIIIDEPKVSTEFVKSVVTVGLDSRIQSMEEQILSRSKLQPLVDRYNLYANSHESMDDKVNDIRRAIVVKVVPTTLAHAGGLPGFYVLFTAADARTAQQVCAEIAGLFISENNAIKQAASEGTTDFLKSQLADAQRSLDEHDAKLKAFQEKYMGRLPGETATNSSMLTSLNTQLAAATQAVDRAEQDKIYEESLLAQLNGSSADGSSGIQQTVPNPMRAAKEQELQRLEAVQADLQTRYTADNPDVMRGQKQISDLQKQIVQMPAFVKSGTVATVRDNSGIQQIRARIQAANADLLTKRKIQQSLQAQAAVYQAKIASSPQVEQEYNELDRGYQEAKKFYDGIAGQMYSAKMSSDLDRQQQGEQFRILDPANLPDSPVYPNSIVFIGGGILAGLVVGLLIAAALEYRNTALRSERDVWAFTQLPTLAVIGLIDEHNAPIVSGRKFRFFKKKAAKEALASAS